jgi:hypothetical protein
MSPSPFLHRGRHPLKEVLQPGVKVIERVYLNLKIGLMQLLGGPDLRPNGLDDLRKLGIDGRLIVKLICGNDLW